MVNDFVPTEKKPGFISHLFDDILFGDAWGIRILRIFILLIVIFGCGEAGSLFFESPNGVIQWLEDLLRYMIAPLAAMVGIFLLGAKYVQDIYELESYWTAIKYLFAALFDGPPYIPPLSGWILPGFTISGGQVKKDAQDEVNSVGHIGGPGWLYIEPGNVVVLEYLQATSAVFGAGMHYISRFQKIKTIISSEDQHWIAGPIRATTRDGIELVIHDFQFGYRLYAGHRSERTNGRTPSDPYPFSMKAARTLIYGRSIRADGIPMSWGNSIQFRLDGAITDYINKSFLDQVIAPRHSEGDPRDQINKEMSKPVIRERLRAMLGTELLWHKIGRFDFEDEKIGEKIKTERLNAWTAKSNGSASVVRAQGRAEQISQEESGRAETTAMMLKSITRALRDANLKGKLDDNLWNIVLARTAQIIESMTSIYGDSTDAPNHPQEKGEV